MFFNDVAYAMGNAGQSAGGDAFGSPLSMNILLMVVIFAIFYFLIIRPQQQEAKRLKAMLSALKKGDKVDAYIINADNTPLNHSPKIYNENEEL